MELLVVITIIGILIALLLPAVQAAREAARQTQCRNNLKQLALGCLTHENATGRFPTDGWGYAWTGDADQGTDWRQPGGWIYNILPYTEQQTLHDMGVGLGAWNSGPKEVAQLQRISVPLSFLNCPTRRPAVLYPWNPAAGGARPIVNAGQPTGPVARADYAINGGDAYTDPSMPSSPLWASTPDGSGGGPASLTEVENPPATMTSNARTTFANIAHVATGIAYVGSLIRMSDITDGTTNTYLVGEKYLCPDNYNNGMDAADNEDAMMGDNADIARWSNCAPRSDTPGYVEAYPGWSFGAAHVNGFQMAFCDGSVQMLNYTIDPTVHDCLGNRKDGHTTDAKSF